MKICLVTNEMYPFLPGGIGRLMHNFCMQNLDSKTPVDMHFLLPPTEAPQQKEILDFYAGKARIHFCPPLEDINDAIAQALHSKQAFHPEYAANYHEPITFFHGMLRAEAASHGKFDIIEVADMGGWGHAIIAAKRAGMAFQDTEIACRLHSSVGLITEFERYSHHPSHWFSAKLDIERETILGADIIIGHVPAIIRENARHYSLSENWVQNVIVEFPPIPLDTDVDAVFTYESSPDFVFSSRLQPFKRPELFIRAAVLFLERNPEYAGKFRLMSYGWDVKYIEGLELLVPEYLQERIVFQKEYTQEERNAVLKKSVIVIPSNYESLCLFAYESSQMGRPVILAADCAAFGDFDRWKDAENCLFFDGDFISLADTMEKALNWQPKSIADTAPDQPYWEVYKKPAQKASITADASDIPVVYYGIHERLQLGENVVRHIGSAFARQHAYFLVPSAVLEGYSPIKDMNMTFIPTSGIDLSCTEVEHLVKSLDSAYVFLARVDHVAHQSFVKIAQKALQTTPDLELFSAHTSNTDPIARQTEYGVTLSTGNAPGMAMLENTVAPPMALVSIAAVKRLGFAPQANDRWFDVFTRKLALDAGKFVIAPSILVNAESRTRERSNSKRLSAGIIDDEGIKAGLKARLLGMDVHVTNKEVLNSRTITFSHAEFASATCVWPSPNPRDYDLVVLQNDNGGLLTHPINICTTIAKLQQTAPAFIKAATIQVRNASSENLGVEFCLMLSQRELSQEDLKQFDQDATLDNVIQTEWINITHMGSKSLTVPINSSTKTHIYLMSRLPDGITQDYYCWAIWKSITFFQ